MAAKAEQRKARQLASTAKEDSLAFAEGDIDGDCALSFDEFLAISRGFICASRNVELADLCSAVGVG